MIFDVISRDLCHSDELCPERASFSSGLLFTAYFLSEKQLIVSALNPVPITLDQFLKQSGIVESGGHAKILIQSGEVLLNGVVEIRRGKKLASGDVVELFGERLVVGEE